MPTARRLAFALSLILSMAAPAQQPAPNVTLIVSAESHAGDPLANLRQQDFSVIDNKATCPITSFRAVTPAEEAVHVILVIDAVNARFSTVAAERDGIQKFLLASDGHLAFPTTLAILQEHDGIQIQQGFSQDGKALHESLAHVTTGLRALTSSTGIYGADDRLKLSLAALHQVAAFAANIPGRKLVLWISPGWPLLSGPGSNIGKQQQESIFHDIAAFTNEIGQSKITIDQINPLGPAEGILLQNYYEGFTKGVAAPNQASLGNLGLQVLALHSGGLVLNDSTDVAGMLQHSVDDARSWYEITIPAQPAEHPIDYHHLQVKVPKPYKARTLDGYYTQP